MPDERDEVLRAVIREVLADLVGPDGIPATSPASSPAGPQVRVETQADLDALVRRVLLDSRSPEQRRAWERGERRAVLGPADAGSPERSDVLRGAVTERVVVEAARSGSHLRLGATAVVTPLARERARRAGVELVQVEPRRDGGGHGATARRR